MAALPRRLYFVQVGESATFGFSGVDRRADNRADFLTARRSSDSNLPGLSVLLWSVGLTAVAGLPAAAFVVHGVRVGDCWPIAMGSGVLGAATIAIWLGVWTLSGRTWPAYLALALLPYWAMAELSSSPADGVTRHSVATIAAIVPAATALILVDRAYRRPDIDTVARLLRSLSMVLFGAVVVFAWFAFGGNALGNAAKPVALAAGAVAVAVWCIAASVAHRCDGMTPGDRQRLTLGLLAFALGSGDRTVGVLYPHHELGSFAFACGRAVTLLGWALVFGAATHPLARARAHVSWRERELRVARDDAVEGWVAERRTFDEARHDLRSLVAGIHGASATLSRYRDFLGTNEQLELESALTIEIARLQHAVGTMHGRANRFALRKSIEPVVVAQRACGASIQADPVDVEVRGSVDAVAAIVQNLLTNARRHAPGAAISITTEVLADSVLLVVSDSGPGLPDAIRRRVVSLFRDGHDAASVVTSRDGPPETATDGHASGGSAGLGLAICARLAAEQGVRLRLRDVPAGTQIELSLPLAVRGQVEVEPSELPKLRTSLEFSGTR